MNRNTLALMALVLASACGQQPTDGNSNSALNIGVAKPSTDGCGQPIIVLAETDTPLSDEVIAKTKANFATAFGRACAKGLLKAEALLDPEAENQGRLFLHNAPEANIASIYLSEAKGNRMVLEYPFVTPDGLSHVPSVEDLEETIYCNVVGATQAEEESTGRCLPD